MAALLLVFGCCVGFCSGVSAAYVDGVVSTWSFYNKATNQRIDIDETGNFPFALTVTIPTANLQPYRMYQVNIPVLKVSNSYQNTGSPSNIVAKSSSYWIYTSVDCYQVGKAFCSLQGGRIIFYFIDNLGWSDLYFEVRGILTTSAFYYSNGSSTYNTNERANFNVWMGMDNNTAQVWDTGSDIPADDAVSAINQQTAVISQQHQETMDKLDSMTDFTDSQQTDLDTSLGAAGTDLEAKLGVLSFADQALTDFISVFSDDPGPAQLTLPGFKIEVDGEQHEVWADTPYSLASLEDDFGPLLTAVRFGLVVLVYAALIGYLGRVLDALLHGSEVKEE